MSQDSNCNERKGTAKLSNEKKKQCIEMSIKLAITVHINGNRLSIFLCLVLFIRPLFLVVVLLFGSWHFASFRRPSASRFRRPPAVSVREPHRFPCLRLIKVNLKKGPIYSLLANRVSQFPCCTETLLLFVFGQLKP